MSQQHDIHSALASVIERFVALKRALGRQFEASSYRLGRLDRFLASQQPPDLTAETFSAWCSSFRHLATSTRLGRMMAVYNLCLYRRRTEPGCFVPDPSQFPPAQPRRAPHIFSESEILRLLAAPEALTPYPLSPLHRQVGRLAVVLLYTTGLRRGELVKLTLGDYDPKEQALFVRDSKFHKSRLLPLSSDAVLEMGKYLVERRQPGFPCGGEAPLLFNRQGGLTGYSGGGLGILMRKLFRRAGIRNADGRTPRVHDLRFTFAIHALLRWYRAGVDVQVCLPALSTYMGHVSVLSTQYYLTLLGPVTQAANERFDLHCSRFLPFDPPDGGGVR